MKKNLIIIFIVGLCLAAGALFAMDWRQEPPAEVEQPLPKTNLQVAQVMQIPGLPEDKWRDGEQWADDEVWRFDLEAAYYYNDTDYLLFGVSTTRAGRQGKIFRMADEAEPEQVCVWPEDSLHEYEDYLSSYYLPDSQKLVLYNERQHTFLVYDNITGQAQEFAVPDGAGLTVDDQAFWLGGGKYLLCRFKQDPEKLQRVTRFINLYDEKTGEEVRLAKMDCAWCCFVPPTAQKPDRFMLLGTCGELLEIEFLADEVKVRQRRAYAEWPPAVPWLYYNLGRPVEGAAGDYVVLRAGCEDGSHYQIVNLNGGLQGECVTSDDNGGGLLAAYGDTVYFSEYFVGNNTDACRIVAYNYADDSRQIIFGTETDGLAAAYPGLWGFGSGAIQPDGKKLLILADDYVVSLLLAAEN